MCVIQFNVTFNVISALSWWYLLVADIVLPHWNAISQAHWYSIPPGCILESTMGKPSIFPWPVECRVLSKEASSTIFQSLEPTTSHTPGKRSTTSCSSSTKSLVWSGQELNPQPPIHQASALLLDHWVWSRDWMEIGITYMCYLSHSHVSNYNR